jgi:hypothetical protein
LAVCYGGGEFYGQHGRGRDGRGTFLEVLPLLLGCFEGGHGRDDRVGRKSIGIHFSRREILVNVNIVPLRTLIAVPFVHYKREIIATKAAFHTTHPASDPQAPRLQKRWGTSLRSGSSMNGSLEATPMSGIDAKSTLEATEKSMRYSIKVRFR